MYETPLTGLVLSGGGARAAYQVGVLRAIARLRREVLGQRSRLQSPFGVIVGTSAGAINAAALACHADRFEASVEVIARVWQSFTAEQVYRADSLGVIRSGAQWLTMLSVGWVIARWRKARPKSLLDNRPLAALLRRLVPLQRLPMMIEQRQLHALAVTASSYGSGEHVTRSTARPGRHRSPGRGRSGWRAASLTHDAPAGVVGHPVRVPGGADRAWARRAGSATARCGRPRRCRRPSTWARSGC
jgi:NTE family protein